MEIRKATPQDYPQILEIYNWAVETSTATFDTEKKSLPRDQAWFNFVQTGLPLLSLEHENEVVGFGLLKPFSDRKAYDLTVELSLYILSKAQGIGQGNAMMKALIDEAHKIGIKSILSKIENSIEASVQLHKKFGFENVGILKEVGFKFNRWLDVLIMQKSLS